MPRLGVAGVLKTDFGEQWHLGHHICSTRFFLVKKQCAPPVDEWSAWTGPPHRLAGGDPRSAGLLYPQRGQCKGPATCGTTGWVWAVLVASTAPDSCSPPQRQVVATAQIPASARAWGAPRPVVLMSAGNPRGGRRGRAAAASVSSDFPAASKETAVNPPRMDADGPTASPTRDEPSSAGQRHVR